MVSSVSLLKLLFFAVAMSCMATVSLAQNTEFTYQGRLADSGGPGPYDFQFRLCATEAGTCSPPLATYSQNGVTLAAGGIFTVKVVFSSGFDGSDRYLEIAAKRSSDPNFTSLTPRQKVTMAPYSRYSVDTAYFN